MTERKEERDANALLKHLREQMGDVWKSFQPSFVTMQPADQLELLVLWNMINSTNINGLHSRPQIVINAEDFPLKPETKN